MKKYLLSVCFFVAMFPTAFSQKLEQPQASATQLPEKNVNVELIAPQNRKRFFPCTDISLIGEPEKQKCADEHLKLFIAANLNKPIELCSETGSVIVEFTIEKDGSIINESILQDIGGGCGAEVLRTVRKMPKWDTLKARERPFRETYQLAVNFF